MKNNTNGTMDAGVQKVTNRYLYNGIYVDEKFLSMIKKHLHNRAPMLSRGVKFELKQICGKEFWGELSRAECILAGKCMVYLEMNRLVPFERVGCIHESPKRYRRL